MLCFQLWVQVHVTEPRIVGTVQNIFRTHRTSLETISSPQKNSGTLRMKIHSIIHVYATNCHLPLYTCQLFLVVGVLEWLCEAPDIGFGLMSFSCALRNSLSRLQVRLILLHQCEINIHTFLVNTPYKSNTLFIIKPNLIRV